MFNLFNRNSGSIDQLVEEYRNTTGAYLFDVRTAQEFQEGHIPGSISLPLDRLQSVDKVVADKKSKIYVYCHSGVRSAQAARILKSMGFQDVINAGGIIQWHGDLSVK